MAYGVTSQGYVLEPYQTLKDGIKERMRQLMGVDVLLTDNSDLGRFCGLMAERLYTMDQKLEGVATLLDPEQATGVFLDGLCGILGIERSAATYSSVELTLTGDADAFAAAGDISVENVDGIAFVSAADVTLDADGAGTVTAIAAASGAILASAGTLTGTDGLPDGFTAVTNETDAEPGAPADTDAILREKRRARLGAAGRGTLDAFYAALFDADQVTGLQDARIIQNLTDADDSDGRPPHSLEVVTIGGNATQIAAVVWAQSPLGIRRVSTAFSYSIDVTDAQGEVHSIVAGYGRRVVFAVALTITTRSGWSRTNGQAQVKAAIVAYMAGLGLGDEINDLDIRAAIRTVSGVDSVTSMTFTRPGGSPASGDIALGLVEYARTATSSVTVTVT